MERFRFALSVACALLLGGAAVAAGGSSTYRDAQGRLQGTKR